MKIKRTIISLLICLPVFVCCQTFSSIKFDFGVNNSKFDFERAREGLWSPFPESFRSKMGYCGEGLVFMDLSARFRLGAGINFTQVRFNHVVTGIITGDDIINSSVTSLSRRISINNIGIPFEAQYIIYNKKINIQASSGLIVYRPFVYSSETKVTGGGANDPVIVDKGLDQIKKPKDLKIASYVGLNLSYPVTENNLISIGGRYQLFFLPDEYYFEGATGNISMVGISIGYEHKVK